ncbi:MAG: alpha/beta hydrolase [Alphaproteobacteria bacterium]|nr:alpha/beta hydrolase [Alphaproteobacteria bacterium]
MSFVWLRDNPVPKGGAQSWITAADGVKLRLGIWRAADHQPAPRPEGEPAPPRGSGTIVLLHGRTEFIEKYFETIGELLARGLDVVTFDWRGQGRSDRLLSNPVKGHVADFADYVADLHLVLETTLPTLQPGPLYLIAHSMGGAVALRYLHDHPARAFSACVLTAPMTGIAVSMPQKRALALTRLAARLGLGGLYAPGRSHVHPLTEPFEANIVTHDRSRFDRNKALLQAEPELILDGPTYGWAKAALETTALFRNPTWLGAIRVPVLLLSAGQEALVDNESHARVAALLPESEHVTIEGARHELLQETRALRARFWQLFDAFVGLGPAAETGPRPQSPLAPA